MRVSRMLSAICRQKATGVRFSWIWVSGWLVRYMWWVSMVRWVRGRDPVCKAAKVGVSHLSCIGLCILLQGLRLQAITAAGGLRVESIPGWGVEAAWWSDGAVVTQSGGLSEGSRGYNWRVLYRIYV